MKVWMIMLGKESELYKKHLYPIGPSNGSFSGFATEELARLVMDGIEQADKAYVHARGGLYLETIEASMELLESLKIVVDDGEERLRSKRF